MSTMSTVDAREHFSELINRTAYAKERVTLTRRGKNIAVLVPVEDLQLLENVEDQIDLQEALTALQEARKVGTISLEAFKDNLK